MIEPWLSYGVRRQVEPFAPFGLLAVFGLLWIPSVNREFFHLIDAVLGGLGIDGQDTDCGQWLYRFWEANSDICLRSS